MLIWLSKANPCAKWEHGLPGSAPACFHSYGEVGKSKVGWAATAVTFLLVGWALGSFLTQRLKNLLNEWR